MVGVSSEVLGRKLKNNPFPSILVLSSAFTYILHLSSYFDTSGTTYSAIPALFAVSFLVAVLIYLAIFPDADLSGQS